jgi:hypothetical protein
MGRRKTLTNAAIAALPSKAKPYAMPDPELPGHYIRVRPSGSKVFCAVGRAPSGKQVWQTIGASTLYGVAEARTKASERPSRLFGRGGTGRGLTTLKPSQRAGSRDTSRRKSSSALLTFAAPLTAIYSQRGARESSLRSGEVTLPSCSTPSRTLTVPSLPTSSWLPSA